MKMVLLLTLLITSLLTLSCASKKEKNESRGIEMVEKVFSMWKDFNKDQSKKETSEIVVNRAQLPKSFTMTVHFLKPEAKNQKWRWDRQEKNQILATLRQEKRTGKTFELINTSAKENDLNSLRTMAAQQGADALLLVTGESIQESNLNTKALSYIVLVPMLFVEGNDVKSTFITQAVLWDVKSSYVHLGVETEGEWQMERPLAFRQKSRALEKSKEEAIRNLKVELRNQMGQVKI